MRWLTLPLLAVLTVFGLFWLMHWLVLPPEGGAQQETADTLISVAPPPPDNPQQDAASSKPVEAPPAPPQMPSIAMTMDVAMPVDMPAADVSELSLAAPTVEVGGSAVGLEGFGGFAPGFGLRGGP